MYYHRLLLLLIPVLAIIFPLMVDSWQDLNTPWYTPYVLWLAAVIIAFILERRRNDV